MAATNKRLETEIERGQCDARIAARRTCKAGEHFVVNGGMQVRHAPLFVGKGAAGQMIQCANLMLGLDEDAGLAKAGLWP